MVPGTRLGTEQAFNKRLLNVAESVYSLLVHSLMVQKGRGSGSSFCTKGTYVGKWARTHNLLALSDHSNAAEVSQWQTRNLRTERGFTDHGTQFPGRNNPYRKNDLSEVTMLISGFYIFLH